MTHPSRTDDRIRNAPAPDEGCTTPREALFSEELAPYGRLTCYTLYAWYDGPVIYVLEHAQARLFVYWFDSNEQGVVKWYLPISAQTQAQLDNHQLCLRTLLDTHPGESIQYGATGELLSRTALPAEKPYDDTQLPARGVFLDAETHPLHRTSEQTHTEEVDHDV